MDHTLTIGRIVHFKLDEGPHTGTYRPAIVVHTWSDTCCQLQVFTDSDAEAKYNDALPPVMWKTSRVHGTEDGQWIWPDEREDA